MLDITNIFYYQWLNYKADDDTVSYGNYFPLGWPCKNVELLRNRRASTLGRT